MSSPLLLADCGNTRLKLAWAHAQGPQQPWAGDPHSSQAQAYLSQAKNVIASANGNTAQVLGKLALRRAGSDLALPVLDAYPGLGLDRQLAGLAAVARARGDTLVCLCGTAVCIDVWRREPHGQVRFGGGMLLPGLPAWRAGWQAVLPQLPPVEAQPPERPASLLADSTERALNAGVYVAWHGAVQAALAAARSASGLGRLVLSGGDADPAWVQGWNHAQRAPWLVLEGLNLLVHRNA